MSRPLWVMAVCLVLAGLASAQSLSDAADKEKARRKELREARVEAKSYTDKDLEKVTGSPVDATANSTDASRSPEAKADDGKAEDATEDLAEPPAEPSAMDQLRQKIDKWRARYREAKAEVDALESEVADLTKRTQPGETGGLIVYAGDAVNPPGVVAEADVLAKRLSEARKELEAAKQRLEGITEEARRDGVRSGQLY